MLGIGEISAGRYIHHSDYTTSQEINAYLSTSTAPENGWGESFYVETDEGTFLLSIDRGD